MLDFDLAEMYAVESKVLKRQVKRNTDRFLSRLPGRALKILPGKTRPTGVAAYCKLIQLW